MAVDKTAYVRYDRGKALLALSARLLPQRNARDSRPAIRALINCNVIQAGVELSRNDRPRKSNSKQAFFAARMSSMITQGCTRSRQAFRSDRLATKFICLIFSRERSGPKQECFGTTLGSATN